MCHCFNRFHLISEVFDYLTLQTITNNDPRSNCMSVAKIVLEVFLEIVEVSEIKKYFNATFYILCPMRIYAHYFTIGKLFLNYILWLFVACKGTTSF